MKKNSYRNGALTVIALGLGFLALGQGQNQAEAQVNHAGHRPTPASPEGGGLISAADQRVQILKELQLLRRQMEQMNAALKGGLSVKVTEMPEFRLPTDDG